MVTVLPNISNEAVRGKNQERFYEIEEIIESPSAFVCIAHAEENKEQKLAFKILREYKDERYHYSSPEERLACQKEALRKNVEITSNVYQGLMRIPRAVVQQLEQEKHLKELQGVILAPGVCESSHSEHTSEDDEYALVMSCLLYKHRLDLILLEKSSREQKEHLLQLLATRIEQMHKTFLPLTKEAREDRDYWGSSEQLLKKLEHNLMHFDMIGRYNFKLYEQFCGLKKKLQSFSVQEPLQKAFEARRNEFVKQCHGDLKANNIWIEPIKQDDNFLHAVYILDAVDFNESYRNIDVLADLAMAVIDVEAIGDEELGNSLKKEYLLLSKQTDDTAKLVLAYYLLEKAIVCAIVCIVYDHCEPDMGQRFLELAKKHADELEVLINPAIKASSTSNTA